MIKRILALNFLIALAQLTNSFGGTVDSHLYVFDVNVENTSLKVLLNDIPLFSSIGNGSTHTRIPMSHLVRRGKNEIIAKISPLPGEAHYDLLAKLEFAVLSLPPGERVSKATTIATGSYAKSKNPPGEKEQLITKQFEANTGITSASESGIPLVESEELKAEVLKRFEEFNEFFKKKDVTSVMKEFDLKFRELSASTGQNYLDVVKDMKTDLSEDFNHPDHEVSLVTKDLSLKIYGYGKVVTLQTLKGKNPLSLFNRKERYTNYYPLYFYRNPKSKKLEVIR